MPHLDSVTTFVAVGAGTRYENPKNNGVAHFLEHMFFKGTKKYPTAESLSNIVDGMGAINNAGTSHEYTFYWIKSSAKNIEKSCDVLSSMLTESLFIPEEIEKEKGVIIEEIKKYKDDPSSYVGTLYHKLHFGNHPLSMDIAGKESIIRKIHREDFLSFVQSYYNSDNMVLVFAGKLPPNIDDLAQIYFNTIPQKRSSQKKNAPLKKQTKNQVNIFYKKTDQANLILGVQGFDRFDKKRHAARVLGAILGEGMSSRLFLQIRERKGFAYHIMSGHETYNDTGMFFVEGGLRLDKLEEAVQIIREELEKMMREKVSIDELNKVKELVRGRLAIRSESTNFVAQWYGLHYIWGEPLETVDEYLKHIDDVTPKVIQEVAQELFGPGKYNLQIIAPIKSAGKFEKILSN